MHRRDDQRAVTISCRPHTPAENGLGPSYFRKAGRPEHDFRVGECIGDFASKEDNGAQLPRWYAIRLLTSFRHISIAEVETNTHELNMPMRRNARGFKGIARQPRRFFTERLGTRLTPRLWATIA